MNNCSVYEVEFVIFRHSRSLGSIQLILLMKSPPFSTHHGVSVMIAVYPLQDQFCEHLFAEAVKTDNKVLLENKPKFLLVSVLQ